jgi:hypothetical protein
VNTCTAPLLHCALCHSSTDSNTFVICSVSASETCSGAKFVERGNLWKSANRSNVTEGIKREPGNCWMTAAGSQPFESLSPCLWGYDKCEQNFCCDLVLEKSDRETLIVKMGLQDIKA